ncbi:MAG: hypothetical protein DYG98_06080 [Haliscomenobacteraceae bacterium CHB4]|nr:hypothetical protein [Haliscomenobacteraceae bacterium CHB4]
MNLRWEKFMHLNDLYPCCRLLRRQNLTKQLNRDADYSPILPLFSSHVRKRSVFFTKIRLLLQ